MLKQTDNSNAIPAEKVKSTHRQGWKQNPQSVKADILRVATSEIASNGLSGSRINVIAEKCETSKRMIYYYFKDKDGLYQAVLESAYQSIRKGEESLELDHLAPIHALEALIEFTFIHHSRNPDYIRLIMIENIHHGSFLKHLETIKTLNAPAINRISSIYQKGVMDGYFREGITPLEIHWTISAFSFFNISNEASFSQVFGDTLHTEIGQKKLISHIKEMILRFVLKPEHACKYIGFKA